MTAADPRRSRARRMAGESASEEVVEGQLLCPGVNEDSRRARIGHPFSAIAMRPPRAGGGSLRTGAPPAATAEREQERFGEGSRPGRLAGERSWRSQNRRGGAGTRGLRGESLARQRARLPPWTDLLEDGGVVGAIEPSTPPGRGSWRPRRIIAGPADVDLLGRRLSPRSRADRRLEIVEIDARRARCWVRIPCAIKSLA